MLTIKELKRLCKSANLPTNGKKDDLILRLVKAGEFSLGDVSSNTLPRTSKSQAQKASSLGKDDVEERSSDSNDDDSYHLTTAAGPSHSKSTKTETKKLSDSYLNNSTLDTVMKVFQNINVSNSLPPIEIIKFNGDPTKFPKFLHRFNEAVLQTSLTNSQKLSRLLQFLSGEAYSSVSYLEGIPDAINDAIEILRNRFGQSYMIAEACLQKATLCPAVKAEDSQGYRCFSDKLNEVFYTLKSMDKIQEVTTFHMKAIVQKLPLNDQMRWRDKAAALRPMVISFDDLVKFVNERANSLNDPVYSLSSSNVSEYSVSKDSSKIRKTFTSVASRDDIKPQINPKLNESKGFHNCYLCKEKHKLWSCFKFSNLNHSDRLKFVTDAKLCQNCLGISHSAGDCLSIGRCSVGKCGEKHHTLLHDSLFKIKKSFSSAIYRDTLLPVLQVNINNDKGITFTVNALLDSGSQSTFIKLSLANRLELPQFNENVTLSTITGNTECSVGTTSFSLSCVDQPNKRFFVKEGIIVKSLNAGYSSLTTDDLEKYSHLQDLSIQCPKQSPIEVIIGFDIAEVFVASDYRIGKTGEPIAFLSPLGWTIAGPISSTPLPLKSRKSFATQIFSGKEANLDNALDNFFLLEENCILPKPEEKVVMEERRSMKVLDDEMYFEKGKYFAPMIWKSDTLELPFNRPLAESRLCLLKKRLSNNHFLKTEYFKTINRYLDTGVAERIPHGEVMRTPNWYLPHHPVISEKKIRIVFDAAAKFQNKSLNEQLFKGPDLINNLVGVLMRFRRGPIVLIGDIESMYHQVMVNPKDKDFLRFLWFKDESLEAIEDFRMKVHIFGARDSPFVANYTLKRAAKDNASKFDESVTSVVNKNFYVDDLAHSNWSETDTCELAKSLVQLLALGGFNLRKMFSNKCDLNLPSMNLGEIEDDKKVLGTRWNVKHDSLSPSLNLNLKGNTKRSVLACVASIYDPLGIVAPATLIPKLILQKTWQAKIDWDDVLPDDLQKTWDRWNKHVNSLLNINIKRCIQPEESPSSTQLHTFCDASERGYGTVTYFRSVSQNGDISNTFVFGKSRTAPIKATSIPRLELQSALLATRTVNTLLNEMDLKVNNCFYWTDSTTVLYYLRNESTVFSGYVARRVEEIRETTSVNEWFYIDGKINPADDASRGLFCDEISTTSRWVCGPSFLSLDQNLWPTRTFINVDESNVELKLNTLKINSNLVNINHTESLTDYFINYFSCIHKLIKAVSVLRKFIEFLRDKRLNKVFTLEDKTKSEIGVFCYVQSQCFFDDILSLRKHSRVKSSSKLASLAPFLDDNGVLRVGGRLQKCLQISFDKKHPICLPSSSNLSLLVIRSCHEDVYHSGQLATLGKLRQRFWVIKARCLIRKYCKNCLLCKMLNRYLCKQKMSDLPVSRVTPFEKPFSRTGVDFYGPINVKRGRASVKVWISLFICFNTKAIFLETCPSLSTSDFMLVLTQFFSRRGPAAEMWSDNGTNFRGCHNQLSRDWKANDVAKQLQRINVKWLFIPPSASHMGGLWERHVRSVKRVVSFITLRSTVDEFTLRTALTQAEMTINSRPLCALTDDVNDYNFLTPNSFLMQDPTLHTVNIISSRHRWQEMNKLLDSAWQLWLRDYLPTLHPRGKWQQRQRDVQVGELVLISDLNAVRGKWVMGRVEEAFCSSDGAVRRVKIRTPTNVIERPIHKICLLEERN